MLTGHHLLLILSCLLLPLLGAAQPGNHPKQSRHQVVFESIPMSCHIQGRIIRILRPLPGDKGSICGRYPCRAQVRIVDVKDCGSSVSLPLNAGDTVTIRFTYTLHATARLFPCLKLRLPGLRRGDVFSARAEQRLEMGSGGVFVVSDYVR